MKLFISYARVDKPYCEQIVKTLDIHDVWYDRRLHAGQAWWDEILRRLDWCDGFVYLLSPESVASDYCQKEFEVARAAGKHLLPVLIQARTPIPDALSHVHYADVSDGLNADAVKVLLDAIYFAERQTWQIKPVQALPAQKIEAPQAATGPDLAGLLADIEALMDARDYDQAVFLLKDLREKPHLPRVILTAITPLLQEAEQQLEGQAYFKEAEREYRPLVALVRGKRTQAVGCEALQDFLARFPDYDPDNLAEICRQAVVANTPPVAPRVEIPPPVSSYQAFELRVQEQLLHAIGRSTDFSLPENRAMIEQHMAEILAEENFILSRAEKKRLLDEIIASLDATAAAQIIDVRTILPSPFEWCAIPAGQGMLGTRQTFEVAAFWMAKYPITNAQFAVFLEAQDGYAGTHWWDFSADAKQWRDKNTTTSATVYWNDDLPRTHVNWYTAVAFCRWLSERANQNIIIPTEQQWQRAAQGDDGREYPWGNGFDAQKCNTRESGIGKPTPVTQYPNGASPYGVMDMAGNVWEWGLNEWGTDSLKLDATFQRLVRGGTWNLGQEIARTDSRSTAHPAVQGYSIGFRVVCTERPPS